MEPLTNPLRPMQVAPAVYIGTDLFQPTAERPAPLTLTLAGEKYVGIRNVDAMPSFLMSIVSSGNLWLFAGSNSAFTAGRSDADHALFPYRTADKILAQPGDSGARSIFLVARGSDWVLWEPWQPTPGAYRCRRNLYKSEFGTSVIFEEINEDLDLRFTWRLTTSAAFGLVRFCSLENLAPESVRVRYLDGWNQILPPGVGQDLFEKYSYLTAAYMRHECSRGLGIFTLNSAITDRPEPCESLRAAAAWSLGHADPAILLSSRQVAAFRRGQSVKSEPEVRGECGAFFVCATAELKPGARHDWVAVTDTGLDHAALIKLQAQLGTPDVLAAELPADVAASRDHLKRRIAAADGRQQTADEAVSIHHFANVLFNCLRGGTLPDGYYFPAADFASFLTVRNPSLRARHGDWLATLPGQLDLDGLRERAAVTADPQLIRLAREYLPLTFSRRHGDPSRPWNRFSIRTHDDAGQPIYEYQGNWRDIFQNWESLAQSYPASLESMVAIFLNASTADGYNPYRITRSGIDWEVEDPHDPWSHIGYWGDHQIIYLLRLLESFERHDPGRLAHELNDRHFAYARVPYEIKGFADLLQDPRHSIHFNAALHRQLLARAQEKGNDGKLVADAKGEVLLVSLAEKLLVPLLAKLSNFVPGGGIWLNTQRPEWNDANNALAGWGLSLVTVGYLRRYLDFLFQIFVTAKDSVILSAAVARFAKQVGAVLVKAECHDDAARFEILSALGQAGEHHRQAVYQGNLGEPVTVPAAEIRHLIAAAMRVTDATLRANRRADGLFHSYNLLKITGTKAGVAHLQLMLEGQVSGLSSGLLPPAETLALLQALRQSELFRPDQHSYLLYPDREMVPFLSRNTLPPDWPRQIPALALLVAAGHREFITLDENGRAHFHGDLVNAASLDACLTRLAADGQHAEAVKQDRDAVLALWESVFQHRTFTGRSGSMFAFEGLGSIYWHMIAKLLLAVAECHDQAVAHGAAPDVVVGLGAAYYDIRNGLGFTKTPEVYGAFPTDPYSHSPRHLGAQQPGMTGQVKEEILTRWTELGIQVNRGLITFAPALLRRREFIEAPHQFVYVDVHGIEQNWSLPANSLAFTYCQIPICYRLTEIASITIENCFGGARTVTGSALSRAESHEVFSRSGEIARLTVGIVRARLLD